MFVQTTTSKLVLQCKDCLRSVTDSETNAYRLIAGNSMDGVMIALTIGIAFQSFPPKKKTLCEEQLSFFPFWQAMEDHESGSVP